MVPTTPIIPNRYDDDAQRLRRLEAQADGARRRSVLALLGGIVVLAALIPLDVLGWGGAGLLLAPLGLGLLLGAGLQLLLARWSS